MNFLHPHQVCCQVYLDPKGLPRHRGGPSAGKRIPSYTGGTWADDPLCFIGTNNYFFFTTNYPFLLATTTSTGGSTAALQQHELGWPPELHSKALSIQPSDWGMDAPGVHRGLLSHRNTTMVTMYQKAIERGASHIEAVGSVAMAFPCDAQIVVKAVNAAKATPGGVKRRSPAVRDPRYKYLTGAAQRARTLAYNSGAGGKFHVDDLLVNNRVPEICPVLKVSLNYEPHDPKQLNAIVVGRIDPDKGYDTGNVAIMTKLASRLITGRIKPAKAAEALSAGTTTAWLEWMETHKTKYKRQENTPQENQA